MDSMIPVIDVFAGPGGLSEGFSSATDEAGKRVFDVCLSIEKEQFAHSTLKLRTFYRYLDRVQSPGLADYYAFLQNELDLEELYKKHPDAAQIAETRSWKAELGVDVSLPELRKRIRTAIGNGREFVLIGGPPCQAYSLAGRSRNKGIASYNPNEDKRQTLYKEYLQIIADHQPAVFVMENVKGLLSAKLDDQYILEKIVEDLRRPSEAVPRNNESPRSTVHGYRLYSFVTGESVNSGDYEDFLIQTEKYGIPQLRHRIIILGIRDDLPEISPPKLVELPEVPIESVISDLPSLRSGLSQMHDSPEGWAFTVVGARNTDWYRALSEIEDNRLYRRIGDVIETIRHSNLSRGSRFVKARTHHPPAHSLWYIDKRLHGVCNHDTRSHIISDIHRYLFASCYASVYGRSPTLSDFPAELLPNHRNVHLHEGQPGIKPIFGDRFRVQLNGKPATTITSHISKDGHYYIHPDPAQCRSLTVREAARVQTFPDNYFFLGARTSQYHQVGNAVPPLLAFQLAQIVHNALQQMGICEGK
jgi:DNA (cytosine-5)-methyltransferase 1